MAETRHPCLLVAGVEPAVAPHACHAPEVLVLAVGAVAPAKHLEGDEVGTLVEKLGDVKFGSDL